MMTAAVSKYRIGAPCASIAAIPSISGAMTATTL